MKNEKEIEAWMRSQGMSGVAVEKIKKLMKQFATPQAFFSARKVDIEAAYRKVSVNNKNGLGNKFWTTFDKVLAFFKTKDEPMKKENDNSESQQDNANQPIDVRLLRMIPVKEVKAVADMMEFLDIEAINLLEIMGFLSNVRFRQKKDESKEVQHDKKDDAKGGEDGGQK